MHAHRVRVAGPARRLDDCTVQFTNRIKVSNYNSWIFFLIFNLFKVKF
jgi:hypothetical protein